MPSPLTQNGAISDPSRFAPIHTNRFITGLWTQRNPLRDAATPYLYEKFYSANRYDSLIGGANKELTSKLTLRRRRGHSIYNAQNFAQITRMYEFRQQIGGVEVIRLVADTAATIYDATGPNTKQALLAKAAGAGSTYFHEVGNSLYMGDGVDLKKLMVASILWAANTAFALGQWIIDSNFNIQQVTVAGISAGAPPAWNAAVRGTTADNTITWTNRGSWVQDWQLPAPTRTDFASLGLPIPTVPGTFWQANTFYVVPVAPLVYIILDKNGNYQQIIVGGKTGQTYPQFSQTLLQNTADNQSTWKNVGSKTRAWQPAHAYAGGEVLLDSNGNLQQVTIAGNSGALQPVWNAAAFGNTVDNTVTWQNVQSGNQVTSGDLTYAYAFHSIDGGLSTASGSFTVVGPIIGVASFSIQIQQTGLLQGQCDAIWVYRTSQDGANLLFVGQVANPGLVGWTFTDTLADNQLNTQLQAPIAHVLDPPPAGLKPTAFHLGLLWGFSGNTLYYSAGPAAAPSAGNPNNGFPPNNYFSYPSQIVRAVETSIGLMVFTISDIYIVLGQNTSTSPLYSVPFLSGIGLLHFDALAVNGSVMYLMTSDVQVIQLDPGAGVVEVGFPIGDQFESTFNPGTAFLTWHVKGSSEKALYVADAVASWFRLNPTPAPEAGIVWSPKGTIAAGCTFMQSLEVSPGVHELLVQTGNNTPILKRDAAATQDNGASFAASAIIGSIVLAQPGQLAELAFLTTESVRVGSKPVLSLLLNEISATGGAAFENLAPSPYFDPPNFPESKTLFSDRYYMGQNQLPVFCRHLQIQFAWPAEAAASELLSYTLFGAIHNEKGIAAG